VSRLKFQKCFVDTYSVTCHRICYMSNTTGTSSGAETAYHSETPPFTSVL